MKKGEWQYMPDTPGNQEGAVPCESAAAVKTEGKRGRAHTRAVSETTNAAAVPAQAQNKPAPTPAPKKRKIVSGGGAAATAAGKKASNMPIAHSPPPKKRHKARAALGLSPKGPATTDTSGLSLLLDAVIEVSHQEDGMGGSEGSAGGYGGNPQNMTPMSRPEHIKQTDLLPPVPLVGMAAARLAAAEVAATSKVAAALGTSLAELNKGSVGHGNGDDSATISPTVMGILRAESEKLLAMGKGPATGKRWLRLARGAQRVGAHGVAREALMQAWAVMRQTCTTGAVNPERVLEASERFVELLRFSSAAVSATAG